MAVEFIYRGEHRRDIPDGVTHVFIDGSIDNITNLTYGCPYLSDAFYCHPNIEEVICSKDVEEIGDEAFRRCPRLRRVVMPGVLDVVIGAFYACPALTDVECDKLEIIGMHAFQDCTSLRSINLSSVREVHECAFNYCKALTSAIFGNKLEIIEEFAFDNCTSLERITIPLKDGVITHDNIFTGCENLKHVDLVEEEELRETVAALHLEKWRNDMIEEIDSINQILPDACAGYGNDGPDEDFDAGDKARVIREWIERVLGKINDYKEMHRRILDEAAMMLELALWKKSLRESDQAFDGVEGAEESITRLVKNRKAEAAASDPARAECRLACGADMNVVIKSVLPFLELPPHTFEMGGIESEGNAE